MSENPSLSTEVGNAESNSITDSIGKTTESTLDDKTLEILGEDPLKENLNEATIHQDLANRWSKWITVGIKKEDKTKLTTTYPRAKNCLVEGQILNAEVARMMNSAAIKRDKYARDSQNLTGSAMVALGLAISILLNEKEEEGIDRDQLLQYLVDTGKLLCEIHHHEATTRRSFIIPGIDKNMKSVLEDSKIDKYLFGEGLNEKIKSERAIVKIATDLKAKPLVKSPLSRPNNLNSRFPPSNNQGHSKVGNKRFYTTFKKNPQVQRNPELQNYSSTQKPQYPQKFRAKKD